MDSLGDRMKRNYEDINRLYLTRRVPVIIRLDGRAFHNLLQNANKPFDTSFVDVMVRSAVRVVEEIQGFKAAYVQSDEVNILLTDYDTLTTQGWFDYNLQKIVSISASLMSVWFSFYFSSGIYKATFDSRAFNIPREEVSNYFLWRMLDWERNSIQMYTRAFFSHNQLLDKNQEDMHEMLHSIGKNWTMDVSDQLKNGTWVVKTETKTQKSISLSVGNMKCLTCVLSQYEDIAKLLDPLVYCDRIGERK